MEQDRTLRLKALVYKAFGDGIFELLWSPFLVPVSPYPNWYTKSVRYIKAFSPLWPERFNWYKNLEVLSVGFGSDTTRTPIRPVMSELV